MELNQKRVSYLNYQRIFYEEDLTEKVEILLLPYIDIVSEGLAFGQAVSLSLLGISIGSAVQDLNR